MTLALILVLAFVSYDVGIRTSGNRQIRIPRLVER